MLPVGDRICDRNRRLGYRRILTYLHLPLRQEYLVDRQALVQSSSTGLALSHGGCEMLRLRCSVHNASTVVRVYLSSGSLVLKGAPSPSGRPPRSVLGGPEDTLYAAPVG